MNATTTKLPNSQVKLTIEVDQAQMVEYFAQAYARLAPHVTVKGFRSGSAPKSMVLEKIGVDRYTQEAVNLAIVDSYYQAVHEQQLVPLTQPAVALHEFGVDSALKFDATVDVLPTVQLGEYQKLSVKLPTRSTEVTEADVATVVKRLRFQAASFDDVDRPAAKGDRLEIHFTGKVRGAVQDDLTSQHYPLILGETELIPGFEAQLLGLKKGDGKSFTLKVDAPKKHGGAMDSLKEKLGFGARTVAFTVQCLQVQAVTLPELDQTFSKTFGHASVATLTDAIRAGIGREKATELRRAREEAVLEALRKSVSLELPQTLIDQELERRIEHVRQQFGKAFDVFLKDRYEGSLEKLRESQQPEAERSVAAGLIIGEVARQEKLVPEGGAKTPEEQSTVMKRTLDRLISFAEGKKR